jgi:hypothetical protein
MDLPSMSETLTRANKARLAGVWVLTKDLVYVRAVISELDEQGIDHTAMLRFDGNAWSQYMIPAAGVAHCVIPEDGRTVLTLSPGGIVHVAKPEGFSWETLDNSEEGPTSLRQMRDIRPIDGHVYAVGMGRMIYRRSPRGAWARFDESLRGNRGTIEITGFLAIDGCSESHIYAVGFKGEMWCFNGKRWSQIDSPTNMKLERVRVVSPDLAVACGGAGTILLGSRDKWRVVSHEITKATFWGLEYFEGKFYLADNNSVYTFDGSQLLPLDSDPLKGVSTGRLHAADGVLWSVGEKDIVVFDGNTWRREPLNL